MRCPDLGDVHLELAVLPHEDAGRARMVEVDMAQQQVANVRKGQAVFSEPVLESRNAGGRAAVVEREPARGLEEVAADDALGALVAQIDELGQC